MDLVNVIFIHRHGERTPIKSFLPTIVPSATWNSLCNYMTMFSAVASIKNGGGIGERQQLSEQGFYTRRMDDFSDSLNPAEFEPVVGDQNVPGKCYIGQLTDKGRHSLERIGGLLRERYVKKMRFLPEQISSEFVKKSIYLRSTDYPRTVESLSHLLQGLFPLKSRLFDHPLSIQTKYVHDETLIGDGSCAKWNYLVKSFKLKYREHSADHIEGMRQKYKTFLSDPLRPSLHALYDTFIALHAHSLPLPSPITFKDIKELEKHAQMLWFEVYRHDPEATRLCIGRFLGEIGKSFQFVADGKTTNKLAIYSGHDSTIAPLLGAFGIGDGTWPPFGANLAVELYRSKQTENIMRNDYYVKVRYNFEDASIPYCELEGNGHPTEKGFCTLDAFLKHVDTFVPKDYSKECMLDK